MILYEFEGKELLNRAGINIPRGQLVESSEQEIALNSPLVLKAQVLSGKRADNGGIAFVEDDKELKKELQKLLGSTVNHEKVEKVLVEERIEINGEYYLSITYDTDIRSPVLTISEQGGSGIEKRTAQRYQIDPLNPLANLPETIDQNVLSSFIKLFFDQDCLLLEINPLVKTKAGQWVALDAKIKLDDYAKARHEEWSFPPRSIPGYTPTKREIEAKKIDEGDYRGTAGSSYVDLEGDIAVLSSGGGVSLTALDALIACGGKPANFTEYSGNPPKEKVVKLTKIVLSKPNIHGLWVIGTVVANFTDIYETLSGLIDGLRQAEKELGVKFDFPIVIRRGGPRVEEAYQMLKEVKDFEFHLQGPETSIGESARVMAELAHKYARKKGETTK